MAPGASDLAGRHSVYDERFEKVYQQLPGECGSMIGATRQAQLA